ncbi:phiSA1p31-related protein [Streptomyces sp. ISL-12]|uniref:phiSA1p31-related protein n=1 Tax=Streptomyces sp. ISL-12 TaxID=2819177 RepID=UPI001BED28DF|nr:phiSA1p31-related protein [Streptomyces sp. ISL-12]MBT2412672.1 phiSA1p31-related protein [Streptomyces sp. ISL-12]
MSDVFKVGQKVRYRGEEVTVTYGPYTSVLGLTRYLVKGDDGAEMPARSSEIYAIPTPPAFAVGDTVTYEYGGGGKIVAGPFTSEYHEEPIWVVEKPNGTHLTPTQNSLTKVETPVVKVGDRVRIIKDSDGIRTGEYVGLVGTLERVNGSDELVYLVRFGDGSGCHGDKDNGRWWCASVEPVTDETTYEYDGVVYDLTAKYRDRQGDSLRIKLVNGLPLVAWFGCIPEEGDDTLSKALAQYGPFTRVTD